MGADHQLKEQGGAALQQVWAILTDGLRQVHQKLQEVTSSIEDPVGKEIQNEANELLAKLSTAIPPIPSVS